MRLNLRAGNLQRLARGDQVLRAQQVRPFQKLRRKEDNPDDAPFHIDLHRLQLGAAQFLRHAGKVDIGLKESAKCFLDIHEPLLIKGGPATRRRGRCAAGFGNLEFGTDRGLGRSLKGPLKLLDLRKQRVDERLFRDLADDLAFLEDEADAVAAGDADVRLAGLAGAVDRAGP